MEITDRYTRTFDAGIDGARRGADGNQRVEFFDEPFLNEARTAQVGRPQYDSRLCIRIRTPGDLKNVVVRKAHAVDFDRWPREYEAYKKAEKLSETGTPIEQWPLLSRQVVADLKHSGIYTLEELAGLTDEQCQGVGILGLRTLRAKAKAHIELSETGKVPAQLIDENDRLKSQLAQMQAQMLDMNAKLEGALRKGGHDPSEFAAAHRPATPQPAIVAAPQPAPEPIATARGFDIPANLESLSKNEAIELAEKAIGMKFASKREAIEALEELAPKTE